MENSFSFSMEAKRISPTGTQVVAIEDLETHAHSATNYLQVKFTFTYIRIIFIIVELNTLCREGRNHSNKGASQTARVAPWPSGPYLC